MGRCEMTALMLARVCDVGDSPCHRRGCPPPCAALRETERRRGGAYSERGFAVSRACTGAVLGARLRRAR
jgi:hypothetical protein